MKDYNPYETPKLYQPKKPESSGERLFHFALMVGFLVTIITPPHGFVDCIMAFFAGMNAQCFIETFTKPPK